jgi:hypothetical protein
VTAVDLERRRISLSLAPPAAGAPGETEWRDELPEGRAGLGTLADAFSKAQKKD